MIVNSLITTIKEFPLRGTDCIGEAINHQLILFKLSQKEVIHMQKTVALLLLTLFITIAAPLLRPTPAAAKAMTASEMAVCVGGQPPGADWYVGINVYITGNLVYWCAGGALAGYLVGGTIGAFIGACIGGIIGWIFGGD